MHYESTLISSFCSSPSPPLAITSFAFSRIAVNSCKALSTGSRTRSETCCMSDFPVRVSSKNKTDETFCTIWSAFFLRSARRLSSRAALILSCFSLAFLSAGVSSFGSFFSFFSFFSFLASFLLFLAFFLPFLDFFFFGLDELEDELEDEELDDDACGGGGGADA